MVLPVRPGDRLLGHPLPDHPRGPGGDHRRPRLAPGQRPASPRHRSAGEVRRRRCTTGRRSRVTTDTKAADAAESTVPVPVRQAEGDVIAYYERILAQI